jgi:hypothetical protein
VNAHLTKTTEPLGTKNLNRGTKQGQIEERNRAQGLAHIASEPFTKCSRIKAKASDRYRDDQRRHRDPRASAPETHTSISKYKLFFLHGDGILASQYFLRTVSRARSPSSADKIRAVASNSGPVIFPRMVHGAIRTLGLFRIRLHFPAPASLVTYNLPPSSPNHTGV